MFEIGAYLPARIYLLKTQVKCRLLQGSFLSQFSYVHIPSILEHSEPLPSRISTVLALKNLWFLKSENMNFGWGLPYPVHIATWECKAKKNHRYQYSRSSYYYLNHFLVLGTLFPAIVKWGKLDIAIILRLAQYKWHLAHPQQELKHSLTSILEDSCSRYQSLSLYIVVDLFPEIFLHFQFVLIAFLLNQIVIFIQTVICPLCDLTRWSA